MPRFEDAILRKILPSPEEDRRIQGVVRDVMRILETKIAAKGLAAKPLLVGSVAKGVHLTGTEIDIFVTFPPDTPREVLEREGLAFGDVLERPVRMYAEHPYTRGWYGGFEVEIVPCYRITDATQRMSAVGIEQLATFVHAAREYLAAPSERFFFPRPLKALPISKLRVLVRKRGSGLLAVSIPAPALTEDVLYPQLRKAHRSFADLLHRSAFQVFDSRFVLVGMDAFILFYIS